MYYKVYDIDWDTDWEDIDLPNTVTVEVPDELPEELEYNRWDIDDYIIDKVSEEYWFTIFNCETENITLT